MNTHTPGSWKIIETEPGIAADMDVVADTGLIARVIAADDAVLIAAAPDLLAALCALLRDCEHLGFEGKNTASVKQRARAAIAAATGSAA